MNYINETNRTCVICYAEYTKSEVENPRQTIELACGHLFHLACLAQVRWNDDAIEQGIIADSYEETVQIFNANPRSCPYCRSPFGVFFSSALDFTPTLETFLIHLRTVEENYGYDQEMKEAIAFFRDRISGNNPDISKISDRVKRLIFQIKISSETLCPPRFIKDEVERWEEVPSFERYPEGLRERGVTVIVPELSATRGGGLAAFQLTIFIGL